MNRGEQSSYEEFASVYQVVNESYPQATTGGLAVGMKLQSSLKKSSRIKAEHTERCFFLTNARRRFESSRRNLGQNVRAQELLTMMYPKAMPIVRHITMSLTNFNVNLTC